jgi:predicted RNA methylase
MNPVPVPNIDKSKLVPLKNIKICGYLSMLNDEVRNRFYSDALQKHAKDKVVLDMGTGTGILAYYALSFGAKFVYCVEQNPDMAQVAQSVLEKKFSKDKFKVVVSNFWNTNLDEVFDQKIDILLSETVGPGLFDQGMINTWHCVKPYLTECAISIPDRLHCDAWIYENSQLEDVDNSLSTCLYTPAIHDDDFVKLLLQTDQQTMLTATHWQEVNKIKSLPIKKISDVVSYTMEHGPVVSFIDHAPVGNIKANIDFEVDLLANSTIIIVNKISFENQIFYLKDGKYMPWKYAPRFGVAEPGRYKFSWQNHELEHMSNHEWKHELVE